ncbi:MAG: hypothetical protein U0271_12020 [Polyangiaceae bacterium]
MAITSLSCEPPVRRPIRAPKPDYELFDTAVRLFGEGSHRDALHATLEHLFGDFPVPDLAAGSFTFVQGSSRVTVALEGDELSVIVPLVRLVPEGKSTAALRFLLTRMSASGQLYQPRLRGDEVRLEFRDKLSRLHPVKVMEVLRRMPVEADANDDWMVDQFGVQPLDRVPIASLDPAELERSVEIWSAHWGEVEELLKESQRKRSMFFLNEVCAFAYYHLQYALPLTGAVLSRLTESSRVFNDSDEDPMKRENTLAKCVKEMKALDAVALGRNLGHADFRISPLQEGNARALASHLGQGDYMEAVGKIRTSGKSMDAAIGLFSTYVFLLARFSWPQPVEAELQAGLAQASKRPFREAASALWLHAKTLIAKYGKEEDEEQPTEIAGESPVEETG